MTALHTGAGPQQFPLALDLAIPVVLVGGVVFLVVAYHLYRHDDPWGEGG